MRTPAGYQSYGSRPMGTHSLCKTRRPTRSYTECTSCTQRGTTARPASSSGASGHPRRSCSSPTERSLGQSCRTRQSSSHQHLQSYRNDPDELARGTRWASVATSRVGVVGGHRERVGRRPRKRSRSPARVIRPRCFHPPPTIHTHTHIIPVPQ